MANALDCNIAVSDSAFTSDKYPWEKYEPPYPPNYGLYNTATVLLYGWLLNKTKKKKKRRILKHLVHCWPRSWPVGVTTLKIVLELKTFSLWCCYRVPCILSGQYKCIYSISFWMSLEYTPIYIYIYICVCVCVCVCVCEYIFKWSLTSLN